MYRNFISGLPTAALRMVIAAAFLAPTLSAQAPRATSTTTTIVRGTVFDSLAMQPVAKATVWIPGGTQTVIADDDGKFELDNVPVGRQFIAFSSTAIDSLGLGTLGAQVDVASSGTVAQLATPSYRTLWRLLCANVPTASRLDSGIVWGTVRDANTDTRLSGASASFTWYTLTLSATRKTSFREMTHQARTDSTGTYYACGLPSDIKIASEASGTRSASGTVEYVIGLRRLYRVDMLVSTDMVLQADLAGKTAADSFAAMRPHGNSVLRGTVRNEKGEPVANATITLASVDTSVRSNAAGQFTMLGLPAGSHVLQARQVGFAPATSLVELRPAQTTTAVLEMPSARALAAVNVRGDRSTGRDQAAFNTRVRTGMGFVLTESALNNKFDVYTSLLGLPGVQVERRNGAATIMMNVRGGKNMLSGGGSTKCVATIYLDGMRADSEQLAMYPPEKFRAVEVYNNRFTAPIGFEAYDCGVVLFWTKTNPRW